VRISVGRSSGWLTTTIADDGVGIDAAFLAGSPTGNGLRGLIRRLGELRGTLTVQRAAKGTRVDIRIPLTAEAMRHEPQAQAQSHTVEDALA
jgi:signal transduction histidine kinase